MNAAIMEMRTPAPVGPFENEVRNYHGKAVRVRVPRKAVLKTDVRGDTYVPIEHPIPGGIIVFRLYGFNSQDSLARARGKLVCAALSTIVLSVTSDRQQETYVKLGLVEVLQWSHRVIVHRLKEQYRKHKKTDDRYDPPSTNSVIEIRKR